MYERSETWGSFWGELLRIDFFAKQWGMYEKVADARAEWLEQSFKLDKQRPVLSVACGEGGIELALARRGYQITGIDKCQPLVNFARDKAATEHLPATFLTADLLADGALPGGNGAVLCFDTLGLLSQEQEQGLLKRMVGALAPGGRLLVDGPQREHLHPGRTWWPVRDGHLLMETRYDQASHTQVQLPLFIEPDGSRVSLEDPYDESRGAHPGVQRYIYEPRELANMVVSAGLPAEPVKHHRAGFFMVYGNSGLQAEDDL